MATREKHLDPHLLSLSPPKMKETLIKLVDEIFPFYLVPGKMQVSFMWLDAATHLSQAVMFIQHS